MEYGAVVELYYQYTEKNLCQHHSVHHKSQMD